MSKGSYVYVVTGSEDGVMGTLSSKEKADRFASQYVYNSVDEGLWQEMNVRENVYTENRSIWDSPEAWASATVERWIVE